MDTELQPSTFRLNWDDKKTKEHKSIAIGTMLWSGILPSDAKALEKIIGDAILRYFKKPRPKKKA